MQIHPMPEKRLCLNYAKMYGIRTREKPAVSLLQIQMLRDHTFLNCVDLCGTGINRGGIYNNRNREDRMKKSQKYCYLMSVLMLLLMIGLVASFKNKRPSSIATITESIEEAADENKSCQTESNISEDETLSANVETLEEETISAIPETLERETVPASLETEEQTEMERSHAIEGIPGYKYVEVFPVDLVFASDESVKFVSDLYDEIGFEGKFQSGDETVYEFYRQKFALLLDGKVTIYDTEGNESLLYDRYIPNPDKPEKFFCISSTFQVQ